MLCTTFINPVSIWTKNMFHQMWGFARSVFGLVSSLNNVFATQPRSLSSSQLLLNRVHQFLQSSFYLATFFSSISEELRGQGYVRGHPLYRHCNFWASRSSLPLHCFRSPNCIGRADITRRKLFREHSKLEEQKKQGRYKWNKDQVKKIDIGMIHRDCRAGRRRRKRSRYWHRH